MKALSNNTLIAISKHTNKVLKMATYMAQSEQPMLLDNVYMIDNNTPQKEALELFQKDFDKTVDLIEKSHQLLSTVRADHIVEQLDNNNKDIRTIFLDKYNEQGHLVTLPSITLHLKLGLEKESVRNSVCQTVLGIEYKAFKDFLKNCDKIYKLDEYSIETEEDAVEYLSSIAYREKYDEIVNRIKEIAGEFSEYRETLGLKNRNLIDNEITFTRSMIDSVMKNSTYITKDNVEQLASPHKKNMGDVQRLYKFIKDNNYINAIELDSDTSLKAVIDILQKTEDLKLNIKEQFCLKCRKLGNYNANGLYLPRQHIAAVDITNPSALIHELTHTADISNPELFNHKLREELINKVKKRIDVNDLSVKNKLNYYLNSEEVIARLGEISYILNKNGYNSESMEIFVEKVKLQEKEYNSDFLNIAKPINHYLDKSNIYFNFDKMTSKDLMEIKEYFTSYFGVNNDEIKPIYSKAIEYEFKPTKKAKKTENKYKDSPFVKLDPLSVVKALDYNLAHNVIPFDDLFTAIAENIQMIARKKKGISMDDFNSQLDTASKIYDWVAASDSKDIKMAVIKNMYMFGRTPQAYAHAALGTNLYMAENESQIDKLKSQYNAMKNCHYLKDRAMSEFRTIHKAGLVKVLNQLSFEDIFSRIDKNDLLTHAIIFTETFRELYNQPQRTNKLESHVPQILSDAKQSELIKLITTAVNSTHSHDAYLYIFNMEKRAVLSEPSYRSMATIAPVSPDSAGLSLHYAAGPIRSLFSQTFSVVDLIQKKFDATPFNNPPLLGTLKVSEDNFRENRKQIMDQYLKELQEKQAREALENPKKEESSIVTQLKKKIEDEKESEIIKHIEPVKPMEPIKQDKANQMKLF